jgi:Leucine-rich repeat (LRR) protein
VSPEEMTKIKSLLFSDDYAVRQQGKELALSYGNFSTLLEGLSEEELTGNESILYLYLSAPSMKAAELEELSLYDSEILDFKFTQLVPNLKKLTIENGILEDYSELSSLTNLTELKLNGCKNLTDISPIKSLLTLKTLDLSQTSVADLGPLAGLVELRKLVLWECYEIRSLQGIEGLVGLTSLSLADSTLSDFGELAHLQNLVQLNLSCCKELIDLTPLASLTKLVSLYIDGCWSIKDLGPLSSLTNLGYLNLVSISFDVTDLSPLHSLTDLDSLELDLGYEEGELAEEFERLFKALPNEIDIYH